MVQQALENGYDLLDCACDYGNEVQVGQGIANAIANGKPRCVMLHESTCVCVVCI